MGTLTPEYQGSVPISQLNSLPLVSAKHYLNPGDGAETVVFSGHVTKYWQASDVAVPI
jgi:hypothetical protein